MKNPSKAREWLERPRHRRQRPDAFSLTDFLAILGVSSLLVLLQFTSFAHNKGNSHRAVCADNLRRLALSWLMYADDNRDRLAPNLDGGGATTNSWVGGWLDYSPSPENTNLDLISRAKLYPYNREVEIYRCPADLSMARGQLRVRSYSMNAYVGDGSRGWTSGFQTMTNCSQVRQPDQTFVFIEEHPESINDGFFAVDMSVSAYLVDYPALYHLGGANLGFADGSVRYREWLSVPAHFGLFTIRGPDVAWLQSISTYRK